MKMKKKKHVQTAKRVRRETPPPSTRQQETHYPEIERDRTIIQEVQQINRPKKTNELDRITDEAGRIVGDITNQINHLVTLRRQVREKRDIEIAEMTGKTKQTREKPRIIENIQIRPPDINSEQAQQQQEWQVVERRKPKRNRTPNARGTPNRPGLNKGSRQTLRNDVSKPNKRRIPKTAAVTIKTNTEEFSYADVLRKARESVSLRDIGIEDSKIRKARNGAIVIEVPGADANELANKLAGRLKDVYGERAVVARPTIRGELRFIGIDDSVLPSEISVTVAEFGGCQLDEVHTSEIRAMRNGMGIAWVRCPLNAAVKIATIGKLRIGWTNVKVELLKARPVQCFRCWGTGHVRSQCTSSEDMSNRCFRCGSDGHVARACEASAPKCIICSAKNLNSNHRMGGNTCSLRNIVRKTTEVQLTNNDRQNL